MTLAVYGKSKRRQGGLLIAGLLAILLAAFAGFAVQRGATAVETTEGPLVGTSNGSFTQWGRTNSSINTYQHVNVHCSNTNALIGEDTGDRSSVTLPLTAANNGKQIVRVEVTVCYRDSTQAGSNGTFTPFARVDGTNYDGTNISAGSNSSTCTEASAQLITIPGSVIKSNSTNVQIGVLKTATDGSAVAVCSLRAVVVYDDLADADNDGVPDGSDVCPGTLPGAPGVNAQGCDWAQQLVLSPGITDNPPRPNTCGAFFSIVLDRSDSFSAGNTTTARNAAKAFVTAILTADPTAQFRVVGFGGGAADVELAGPSSVLATIHTAIDNAGNNGDVYTNWGNGIAAGYAAGVDWEIVITDGNPNRPTAGGTSADVNLTALTHAVTQANIVKAAGTHITVIGIDTSGSPPAGFNAISESYAHLVGGDGPHTDVQVGAIGDLESILQEIVADCTPPGPDIVKTFTGLNAAGTEASWTVEVKNNSQTTQNFYLVEKVVATLYNTNNCQTPPAVPVTSSPPTESPWHCGVPSGQTGTYYLTTPVNFTRCEGGTVVNDYFVRFTGPNSPTSGIVEHSIPGVTEECGGTVIVHKVYPAGVDPDGRVFDGSISSQTGQPLPWSDAYNTPSTGYTINNVPAGTYTVDEDPEDGYAIVGWATQPGLACNEGVNTAQLVVPGTVADSFNVSNGGTINIYVCNAPYGELIINKIDGTSDGSVLWDFTVTGMPAFDVNGDPLDSTPQASGNDSSTQTFIPLGSDLLVTEDDFRSPTACASANSYYTIVTAPADRVVSYPGEEIVYTFSNQPCGTLGSGGILIEKWEDVNGDGIISAGDQRLPGWTFTTTGGGIPGGNQVRVTNASGQILDYVSGFDAGTILTTSETLQPGWVFVGSDVDGGPMTNDASPDVAVVGGETIVVRFLNERAEVNIRATKTIYNAANPAGANGGAGWTFTLAGCGQPASQKTTDATGSVSWAGLPAAVNCMYTVTETAKAGWVADQLQLTVAPVNNGQTVTLTFVNRQIQGCTNIADCPQTTTTPTSTPVTPTNTPGTGETPTNTPPADATPTNTPEEDIAGEVTPGPGQPTPAAPDTGAGFGSQTAAGMNILLLIAGLIAISGGLSFIALGRRPNGR